MVDVGDKAETRRVAVAEALVIMSPATLRLVVEGSGAKGDVFATARLAGIAALKRTADWIPLCHPVRVVGTDVALTADPRLPGLRIQVTVQAFDRTGVEMEAMVGVAAAALTVYDMVKGVERGVRVQEVRLLEKSGGRSGQWVAPSATRPPSASGGPAASGTNRKSNPGALRESKGSRIK
jgi:cyclic pyranopterin monophosphate synthase